MLQIKPFHHAISSILIISLILVSMNSVRADVRRQQAKMAEITITGKSVSGSVPNVTVNGEPVVSGQSIFLPAEIFVAAGVEATLNLGKTGRIEISSGTGIKLKFDENTISGDLSQGRVKIFSASGTNAFIKTEDAEIINDKTQVNSFIVEIVGFTTALSTETGLAKINNVNVAAGQSTSALPNKRASQPTRPRVAEKDNTLIYVLLGGAAAAIGVVIALAAGGNNSNNVSPTR